MWKSNFVAKLQEINFFTNNANIGKDLLTVRLVISHPRRHFLIKMVTSSGIVLSGTDSFLEDKNSIEMDGFNVSMAD